MHAIDMIELLLLIIQFSALFQSGKRDSTRPPCHGVAREPGEDGSPFAAGSCIRIPLCGANAKTLSSGYYHC